MTAGNKINKSQWPLFPVFEIIQKVLNLFDLRLSAIIRMYFVRQFILWSLHQVVEYTVRCRVRNENQYYYLFKQFTHNTMMILQTPILTFHLIKPMF